MSALPRDRAARHQLRSPVPTHSTFGAYSADKEVPDLPEVATIGTYLVRHIVLFASIFVVLALLTAGVVTVSVTVHSSVSGDGFIRPAATWPVRAAEAGLVDEVLVHTGDTVQPSEPVVRLDTLLLAAKLAQLRQLYDEKYRDFTLERSSRPLKHERKSSRVAEARAHLLEARAALRTEMSEYAIFGDLDSLLQGHRLGTHVGLDPPVAGVMAAQAALHTAEAEAALDALDTIGVNGRAVDLRLLQAEIRIAEVVRSRLVLRAPVHGVVQTDHVERLKGAFVQVGDPLLEVEEPGAWQADLFLSEQDVHEAQIGDSAAVLLRAFQGSHTDVLYGRVASIAATPRDTATWNQGEQYRVTISLSDADVARVGRERLRKGYSARGRIITGAGSIIELIWRYARKQV